MAPQVIQIGNGKKKGGSGLFYAVGALGTAFAVDYWLSTNKMEEELAKEKSENEISPEKASKALKGVQEEGKPNPVFEPINAEEISKFSNVDDFSEGELEEFLGEELSVSGEECSMPLAKTETKSIEEPMETSIAGEKIISRAKSVESIEVEDFVASEEDASFFPEIPVAIWKVILMVILALLWRTMRTRRSQIIPGLNEEFESEKIDSIPMLGPVTEDASKTAIAVSVDELAKSDTKSTKTQWSDRLGELTFYQQEEEPWGIFAIIVLTMMIL